ncbi:MAG: Epoxide hydrolase [Ktedonobacterales bacterium]|jgi:pimeloyl-ACP methyl ester carboxylesterase|nr:MAG: Epoxide hydrolase [Ktedonobacterales bacterium]
MTRNDTTTILTTSADPRESFPLPEGCVEGYIETNGIRLHYVSAGEGPLVLLLHGFPDFWYSWRYQLPALAERFRVVAPDLRGYNLSAKSATGYDIATLAADVRGLVAAFGERQADIIGHDWGGGIAWAFALRHPDALRRLVIVNAPHPALMLRELRHPGQLIRSLYMGFFQLRGIAERAIMRDDYAVIRRTFRAADRPHAWLTDTDIQRIVDAISRPGALTCALEYYRQLRPANLGLLSPARVITSPTLVLWGELDPYLGPQLLDGLAPFVSDLRIRRFPTSGHWPHQQEFLRVNESLLAFLS